MAMPPRRFEDRVMSLTVVWSWTVHNPPATRHQQPLIQMINGMLVRLTVTIVWRLRNWTCASLAWHAGHPHWSLGVFITCKSLFPLCSLRNTTAFVTLLF